MGKEILVLVAKELKSEWRLKYALNGIILYVVSAVFVTYLSVGAQQGNLNPPTWNALYWVIMLFSALSAVAKSFMGEPKGLHYYYYMTVAPGALILAKMAYNALLTVLLALLGYTVFGLILGNPVQDQGLFLLNLFLGASGLAFALTMVSAIAAKAGSNATLMAILSFPVVLPILLMCIRVSKHAVDGLDFSVSVDKLLTLMALNAIVAATAYILFPYLWRS
ncbi:cytochrome c-type biogenesis protein CcmB [Nitritalea halalkaliphila LW7]|uniref:Cytochrome c-type biogenesis protein CcmB n=1 Tax=Nitritalea halalkaliphila LW7 TaxID=1189621 RepID=I5C177_9BACT|nr:heme exporter protein CcmB [Nitritalea halalkaliphila]EIM75579.1 cytochrome c-type biogenesis protein CcmB [Nitritalea halalkaliphila LW7]